MNILDKIIARKIQQVAQDQERAPVHTLEEREYFTRTCFSLKANLLAEASTGIIAEYKRKSPSKGRINDKVFISDVVSDYQSHGAAGVSVLTDNHFFGGSEKDLLTARKYLKIPILRKDFIISEYQIIEAKSLGADVILLIAACLMPKQILRLSELAKNLGMEVLLEVHNEEELKENLIDSIDIIGVNNRNLKDFTVDINLSKSLASKIPDRYVKISESGISDAAVVNELRTYGYKGFLMGEHFMATNTPGIAMGEFVKELSK